jgi:hemoglobin-like flavoprotein
MNSKQKAIVHNTWKHLGKVDPALIGDVFYSKLFLIDPNLQPMFRTSRDEQSRKLITMLNMIVARLDRLDDLMDDVRKLAVRHRHYGVKASHYTTVGSALLWTLGQGLGHEWNEDVEDAWVACYTLLSGAMIEASEYAPETLRK